MKRSILLYLALLLSISILTANTEPIESIITDVTVYKEGATVVRTGSINLKVGTNQLELVGLPSDLSPETIEISSDGNLDILSIKSEMVYTYKNYEDSKHIAAQIFIQDLQDSISLIEKHAKVYQSEQALIQSNNSITDSEHFTVEELKKLASFHNARIIEIENTLHNYRRSLREMNARLIRLKNESKRKTSDETGQTYSVFIDVESNVTSTQNISIQYYIVDAGWKPTYDVKLTSIQEPLELIYKAEIFQNSDEEWKDVNITVSSASPKFGNNQPYIDPYFLFFNNWFAKQPSKVNRQPLKNNILKGRVTDETGEELIGANVMVKNTTTGTITDLDGTFVLKLPNPNATIVVSYTGYESYESPVISGYMEVQLTSGQLISEVVVTGYAKRSGRLKPKLLLHLKTCLMYFMEESPGLLQILTRKGSISLIHA